MSNKGSRYLRIAITVAILLLLTSANAWSDNLWSYSLGVAATDVAYYNGSPDIVVQEQMVGGEYRGSAIFGDSPFYLGTHLNLSVPYSVTVVDYLLETTEYYDPAHNLYFSASIPLGLRTVFGPQNRIGLYVGAGPAFMMLADYDHHLWMSVAMSVEMGFEYLLRRGLGFSFSARSYIGLESAVMDLVDFDYRNPNFYDGPDPMGLSVSMGISWTSVRD